MENAVTKKCPFCAEEIQQDAVKCKHCGEFLEKKTKWYNKTSVLVMAFLTIGPFALPMVWFHPKYSLTKKIVITGIMVVVTIYLTKSLIDVSKSLMEYSNILL